MYTPRIAGTFYTFTAFEKTGDFIFIFKYRLNSENGGFTPDKSRGPKAPRDLSGVKPMFEVFNRLKT